MATQENLKPFGTLAEDVQRDIRSKGGKARAKKMKERKTIAEALRKILDEPIAKGSRQTKLDGISIKVIKKLFDDPDIRDLKALAEILGELKQTINAEGMTLNINTSEEGKNNIKRILEGE